MRDNTNNLDYYSQICCHLDRDEKCRYFGLATVIHTTANTNIPPSHCVPSSRRMAEPNWIFDTCGNGTDWKSELPQVAQAYGPPRLVTNFFTIAAEMRAQPTPLFPQTFATPMTAFHLNLRADTSHASIEVVSTQLLFQTSSLRSRTFSHTIFKTNKTARLPGEEDPSGMLVHLSKT